MEVLRVSCRQTLSGVDSGLVLLGHTSPQQHWGVASLHHRGNMRSNLHPTTTIGAVHSSFVPLNQVLPTWASCTNRFHCSYIDGKPTAAQCGNLYKHSQPSTHKKPPNLGYCLQLCAHCWSSFLFWLRGTSGCSPAITHSRRLTNLLRE